MCRIQHLCVGLALFACRFGVIRAGFGVIKGEKMDILKFIIPPLIGMVIGYFTNWLAVKMLFFPRRTYYIKGHQVPFTPGVIPRGKARIATAVGEVINSKLLTEEAITAKLSSPEMNELVRDNICKKIDIIGIDNRTLKEYITSYANGDMMDNLSEKAQAIISSHIYERIKSVNLGDLAAKLVVTKADEYLENSFLGKVFNGSLIESFSPKIKAAVDNYIEKNGETIIKIIVKDELANILSMTIGELSTTLSEADINLADIILSTYTTFITKKAGSIVNALNIGSIAEETINSMDNKELEDIVLATMKHELTYIVNIGAVIGLILGCINIFFYI